MFNVDDRVRVIETNFEIEPGTLGTVVQLPVDQF